MTIHSDYRVFSLVREFIEIDTRKTFEICFLCGLCCKVYLILVVQFKWTFQEIYFGVWGDCTHIFIISSKNPLSNGRGLIVAKGLDTCFDYIYILANCQLFAFTRFCRCFGCENDTVGKQTCVIHFCNIVCVLPRSVIDIVELVHCSILNTNLEEGFVEDTT